MTYTVVYRDYHADTFAAAVAEMMLDGDIWARTGRLHGEGEGSVLALAGGTSAGNRNGYAVDHWEWSDYRLRVWFR